MHFVSLFPAANQGSKDLATFGGGGRSCKPRLITGEHYSTKGDHCMPETVCRQALQFLQNTLYLPDFH